MPKRVYSVIVRSDAKLAVKVVNESRVPMVATFWYIDGELWGDEISYRDGDLYGYFIQAPSDHIDFWDTLKILLNKNVEYDYYPRGRVMMNTKIKKFVVVGDPCLMTDSIKEKIIDYYNLPKSTIFDTDEHYTCHNCRKDG